MIGGLFVNWGLLMVSGSPSNDLPDVFECLNGDGPGCDCFAIDFIKGIATCFLCACLGPWPLACLLCWCRCWCVCLPCWGRWRGLWQYL
ncbi:unnamed protein product, partial [Ectocarpus sp. 12 AP-2014]